MKKISVQPSTIETSNSDPFKNDLLNRKPIADALTNLIRSVAGPAVLAVDGAWGSGKTTFLQMWFSRLVNDGFRVISFNAWETDVSNDPLVALTSELLTGLQSFDNKTEFLQLVDKTKNLVGELVKSSLPGVIQLTTGGIVNIDSILQKGHSEAILSFAPDRLSLYKENKDAVAEFRIVLMETVEYLAQNNHSLPLVIMIDELDRCQPIYAVKLLEVAKHLFSIPGVTFVLGVNTSQLTHSVSTLYGSKFDGSAYLKRFINVDVRLPDANRAQIVEATLNSLNVDSRTDLFPYSTHEQLQTNILEMFSKFFDWVAMDYRTVDQTLRRFGLICGAIEGEKKWNLVFYAALHILRAIDFELYEQFCIAEVNDEDAIHTVFSRRGGSELLESDVGSTFAAVLAVGAWDVSGRPSDMTRASRIYFRLRTRKSKAKDDRTLQTSMIDVEQRERQALIDGMSIDQSLNAIHFLQSQIGRNGFSIKSVVDLIEMFSASSQEPR